MEGRDRRLIVALGCALGAALLTIAFLVGRLTGAPAPVTVAMPVHDALTAAGPAVEGSPPSSTTASPSAEPAPETPVADSSSAPSRAAMTTGPLIPEIPAWPTPVPSGSNGAPDSTEVAAYFKQIDGMQDMGGGDPQAFASSLLKSVSSGDFSGFDELLGKARAQRQRLQSIAPPKDCAEHHRLALALSADSVTMLERLKAALMKGDSMALMTMASEGQTLQAQADKLKNMGEAIKRQAGI